MRISADIAVRSGARRVWDCEGRMGSFCAMLYVAVTVAVFLAVDKAPCTAAELSAREILDKSYRGNGPAHHVSRLH